MSIPPPPPASVPPAKRPTRSAPSGPHAATSGGAHPLVSIVTVVRNGAKTLPRAMKSVLAQTYPAIEYVVVDGASSDGTLAVIRRFEHRLARWISEPDDGIGDAFNKGIGLTRGTLIGLLNADDWLEPAQIENAVRAIERGGFDFVFGDLVYHREDGGICHRLRGDPDYGSSIAAGMPDLNHPTVLARREAYERIGGFDPTLRYAMDYDWLLRAHRAGLKGGYAPDVVGHMTLGGTADRDWHRALFEVGRISRRHGYSPAKAFGLLLYRLVKGGARRTLVRMGAERLHVRIRQRMRPRLRTHG